MISDFDDVFRRANERDAQKRAELADQVDKLDAPQLHALMLFSHVAVLMAVASRRGLELGSDVLFVTDATRGLVLAKGDSQVHVHVTPGDAHLSVSYFGPRPPADGATGKLTPPASLEQGKHLAAAMAFVHRFLVFVTEGR